MTLIFSVFVILESGSHLIFDTCLFLSFFLEK